MFNTVVLILISSVVIPFVVQIIKKYSAVFEANKWLTRLVSIVIAGCAAALIDFQLDGKVAFDTWWAVFGTNVLGIEFSYNWIVKTLESMTKKKA